ncbi:hypothetical protein N7476_002070 [Penicillium atrosanguineum]|uniref:Uncharacterized protein n=1 Tax=Penicillium atrosanguineum TaxID=1132637 RepID=A0A9W9Q2Q7_9EURO|nr:hypothetical protein N7476_002070 [Penicillium atrosanguineum]
MIRRSSIFAVISLLAASTMSSPMETLFERDDNKGLTCSTRHNCMSYYKTGLRTCASGYTQHDIKASGTTGGSDCTKRCTKDEEKQCFAEKCKYNTSECDKHQASGFCKDALEWCQTPIKMDKSICTGLYMSEPVSYDETKGTCAPDSSPEANVSKHLRMKVERVGLALYMECDPVTTDGAKYIVRHVQTKSGLNRCSDVDFTKPAPIMVCDANDDRWPAIKGYAEEACKNAGHPVGMETHFESRKV